MGADFDRPIDDGGFEKSHSFISSSRRPSFLDHYLFILSLCFRAKHPGRQVIEKQGILEGGRSLQAPPPQVRLQLHQEGDEVSENATPSQS